MVARTRLSVTLLRTLSCFALRIYSATCVTERNVDHFILLARSILQGKGYKIQITSPQTIFIAFEIGLTKLSPEKRWFKRTAARFRHVEKFPNIHSLCEPSIMGLIPVI